MTISTQDTSFTLGADGIPEMPIRANARKKFSIIWSDWLAGASIDTGGTGSQWSIAPTVTGVPYSPGLNAAPVTIDGVTYAANTVATAWIKDLAAGTVYTVTNKITDSTGQVEERSFRLRCSPTP